MINKTDIPSFKGSENFLKDQREVKESLAVKDLIDHPLATLKGESLFVLVTAALTNIASAIILEPKIVVIWLGGQPLSFPQTWEFNLKGDMASSKLLFEKQVLLVLIPCMMVASNLVTTIVELEKNLKGKSKIGSYLTSVVSGFAGNKADFYDNRQTMNYYLAGINDFDTSELKMIINPRSMPGTKLSGIFLQLVF